MMIKIIEEILKDINPILCDPDQDDNTIIANLKNILDIRLQQSDAEKQELILVLIDLHKASGCYNQNKCEKKESCFLGFNFDLCPYINARKTIEKHTGKTWEQIDVKR